MHRRYLFEILPLTFDMQVTNSSRTRNISALFQSTNIFNYSSRHDNKLSTKIHLLWLKIFGMKIVEALDLTKTMPSHRKITKNIYISTKGICLPSQ